MKFGVLKQKILRSVTESFLNEDKNEFKKIVEYLKSNTDFKELYLLYEDIETKYFDDKELAKHYVEELSNILKKKKQSFELPISTGKDEISENHVYNILDILSENDSLLNVDKKVIAKKELVDFLLTKKTTKESIVDTFTENERILNAVLVNNFNVTYNNNLNEDQKKELKTILSLTSQETERKVGELKESVLNQIAVLLNESEIDSTLSEKLNEVQNEVNKMETSKYNYYRLTQLKNGL